MVCLFTADCYQPILTVQLLQARQSLAGLVHPVALGRVLLLQRVPHKHQVGQAGELGQPHELSCGTDERNPRGAG